MSEKSKPKAGDTPTCCEEARGGVSIEWTYLGEDGAPGWGVLAGRYDGGDDRRQAARFCPFCGATLGGRIVNYGRVKTERLAKIEAQLPEICEERYELLDYLSPGDAARVLVLHIVQFGRRVDDPEAIAARAALDEIFEVAKQRKAESEVT